MSKESINGWVFMEAHKPTEAMLKTKINCSLCKDKSYPVDHYGSSFCESGSLASGGNRSHCTCDWCF